MSYVDVAVGLGFFLFFLALVLMLSIQHFSQLPASTQISDYRDAAMQLFEQFFGTPGSPANWDVSGQAPSQLGLMTSVYYMPITVQEYGTAARVNEPVIVNLTLDDSCAGAVWNTTLRLYDSGMNSVPYQLLDAIACSGNMINASYIRFNANAPQGEKKLYYLFYSNDSNTAAPAYASSFSYSAWSPSDGDSWTEGTTSWSVVGGSGGVLSADANVKLIGSYSVGVYGGFDATRLGILYDPTSVFSGVSDGKYIDFWLYVSDTSSLSSVTVLMNDGTSNVTYALSADSLDPAQWYHFSKNITSSQWTGWYSFDPQTIDYVAVYAENSTAGAAVSLRVDGLHFGQQPLDVTAFPAKSQLVVSRSKVSALNNMSYGDVRSAMGQNYKFRIQIS